MPPSSSTRAKTKASERKPTESDTFQEDVMVTLVSLVTPAKGESNEDKMVLKSSVTGINNKTTKKRPASPCNGAARPLPVMEHTCSRVHASLLPQTRSPARSQLQVCLPARYRHESWRVCTAEPHACLSAGLKTPPKKHGPTNMGCYWNPQVLSSGSSTGVEASPKDAKTHPRPLHAGK